MKENRTWNLYWLIGLGAMTSPVLASDKCAALFFNTSFPNTIVQSAARVVADLDNDIPQHCQVTAVITSTAGSRITVVYRLPEAWNGRMLGLGGAGWAGNLVLATPLTGPGRVASFGLQRGYATAQTDGGHPNPFNWNISWIPGNPEAVTDFSHRAIHEMTVVGKRIIATYYGREASKAYYQGCSTGGRMGMMETQRYPEDYDGVVAGAPVYSLLVQSSSVVRDRIFKRPGASITPEILKLVHEAVVAACDAIDGLKDGVITDPRRCDWNPRAMQCKGADRPGTCLTTSQVAALISAYRTVRASSGAVGSYGLMRGSEVGWNPTVATAPGVRDVFSGNLAELIPLMFGDSKFDVSEFDVEKQQAQIHQSPFAAEYEAGSIDLSRYFKRGGKVILYHGFDDPGPSPLATIDYYERAAKANGGENMRLFVLPGVYHCMGGPGADTFDPLAAITQWVEEGIEPNVMVATNEKSGIERPVCAWPNLPYYRDGDARKASSFSCR